MLYRRRKDNIYSYIWNILNYNTQDALNVTSDVFVKVFNYSKSNDIQKFKSFLYRTAHNEAVNYIASFKSENSL
ncbi:MAG: RNA polymerase sigma factor [Patescibacteria group bacterium]